MARVTFDMRGLREYRKKIDNVKMGDMMVEGVTALGHAYLASAKRNTPVLGEQSRTYKDKTGAVHTIRTSSEHMRRSWRIGEAKRSKRSATIEVYNPVSYATFVDQGHRQKIGRYVPILGKRLVKGFVEGLHITDKAEKVVRKNSLRILNPIIAKYMKGLE